MSPSGLCKQLRVSCRSLRVGGRRDFLTDCILFKSTIRHLWDRCVFGTVLCLYAELAGGICDVALLFGWGTSEIPSEQRESLVLAF